MPIMLNMFITILSMFPFNAAVLANDIAVIYYVYCAKH